ncbi:DEAD/DEAH box helicase [Kineosporia rhizophila]|uniref:DEAD/DEAH box helicase n=1 Tax=Kineosporia rhizophila TaxID=84633 RepID=UPI001E35149A|nr:DEAD/DEAH box helicase [Kineosporia rhizophila]MCE0540439.1 DEAD/DEAH box helicase [Kineosporia rhizophila]
MSTFTPGSLVSARGREWVVLPESAEDMLVLRPLGGSDDDIAAVFPALEDIDSASFQPPAANDLGNAQAAGLLLSAMRIGFRAGAGPFRSMAGIAVEPRAYQLVPLLMALRQPTVRLLISDDVGIGKTVEAGLIATELLAQGSAKGLAILCAPALAEQWQDELREKFGIDAELVLASTAARLERGLDLGQSLFDKHPHVIVSTDFIKSPRHRDDFVKHCADLVIVDEAHTCVAADDVKQRTSNQLRYELMKRIAADPQRHLILVTATPHSGKESAFRNLLGLLEPSLKDVNLETEAGRRHLANYFVQRKRADVRRFLTTKDGLANDALAEQTSFPEDREFKDEPYKVSPEYKALLEDAVAYAGERVRSAQGGRDNRIAWWSAIALLRSMVSSPRAAAQTLTTRSATAAASTEAEADALGAPLTSDSTDSDLLEGLDVAPGAELGEAATRLSELAARAEQLEGLDGDLKLKDLMKHVNALLKAGYRPIVFCRYIPTAEYVAEVLGAKLRKTLVRSVTGTLSPQQRIQRIEDLAAERALDPDTRMVLVATDCLSEGVNLQHHFDAVVHYDLAWNPTRHDQREGRVDRFGQKRDKVRVITMFGKDNGIDSLVLEVLLRKHRQIKRDLGIAVSVPDSSSNGVTDAIVNELMRKEREGEQQELFDIREMTQAVEGKTAALHDEWQSAAKREQQSRSRFAQNAIHPEDVAVQVTALRQSLGRSGEVQDFTRNALNALGAVIHDEPEGFRADVSDTPAGVRDALAPFVGTAIERGRSIPFRTTPAISRGEAALVRTDPVISALAAHVLNAALDRQVAGPRPARRAGVIRTSDVPTRTTLLLVRYRFHLTLPSRASETRQLVAEDARLLAFTGAPANPHWIESEAAKALLEARPDANAEATLATNTINRVLNSLTDLTGHLDSVGDRLAEELLDSHRQVRSTAGEIIRGLKVTAQHPADVLGVYVYLPTGGAN